MKVTVLDFRKGKSTQRCNQVLVQVSGVRSRAMASKFIGKRAICRTPSGRKVYGKIIRTHGNNGVLCARFARGLAIDSLRRGIEILE